MDELSISNATIEEMDFLLTQAKAEGWNPGLFDAAPFYAADPDGYFIGSIGNRKVGCISAVNYNDQFGFMGFYIVLPEFRGRGYGLQLWEKAIEHHGVRSIGLDGVIEQQKNYMKSGFKLAYRNIRYKGKGDGFVTPSLEALEDVSFDTLHKYDSDVFGLDRRAFLEEWCAMPNAYGWIKIEDSRVAGYGVIRQCYDGYKIGPLFADDSDTAEEIFHGLIAKTDGEPFYLDVPEVNNFAMKLAADFGLNKVFETARMYTNGPPDIDLDRVFGVTTFELG